VYREERGGDGGMCSESGDRMRTRVGEEFAVRACEEQRGKLRCSVRVEKGREALREEERRRWVRDGHDDSRVVDR
jgi:hypothetical protein